jgi:protein-disulfide isomerase
VTSPPQTRKERREQAREERKAQEAAEAARAQRNRRLWQFGAVLLGAIVVVGIAIAISSSGGGKSTKPPAKGAPASGGAAAASLLNGIPQKGNVLGNPNAPVTLQEFADLQCPICQAYTKDSLPTLIRDYVRTGKVRMVFHHLPILGPDSQRAAEVSAAAARENRLWNFNEVFYANQGTENTGYVTPAFLEKVARASGVGAKALAQPPSPPAKSQLSADQALANKYAFDATPSFLLGKTGGTPQPLGQVDVSNPSSFTGPINTLLGQ